MRRRHALERSNAVGPWTRRRLQVLLIVAAVLVLALITAGFLTLLGPPTPDDATDGPDAPRSRRAPGSDADRVAAAPMAAARAADARPGPLIPGNAADLPLPSASGQGPDAVPSGFPSSKEGALAQLIAIDQQAMQPLSIANAQQVIAQWAEPGGPTTTTWSGVVAVARLLSTSGMPGGQDGLTLELRPAMGLIKGSVGRDFVVACVDFVATVAADGGTPQRTAIADCQRMRWTHGRWMIAAGAEPAPAPSIWPGTAAAYAAGYRWLVSAS